MGVILGDRNGTVSRALATHEMTETISWKPPESGVSEKEGDRDPPFLIFF